MNQSEVVFILPCRHLALDIAIGEVPDGARDSVIVRHSVQICILEGLWDKGAGLRVVAVLGDLSSVDVLVVPIVEVKLHCDASREVELRVESASAVAGLNTGWGGELVDVGGTSGGTVQALLDAVAFGLDLGEGQIDFCDNAGDIEPLGVTNASLVLSLEMGANSLVLVVVSDGERAGDGSSAQDGCSNDAGEIHGDGFLVREKTKQSRLWLRWLKSRMIEV